MRSTPCSSVKIIFLISLVLIIWCCKNRMQCHDWRASPHFCTVGESGVTSSVFLVSEKLQYRDHCCFDCNHTFIKLADISSFHSHLPVKTISRTCQGVKVWQGVTQAGWFAVRGWRIYLYLLSWLCCLPVWRVRGASAGLPVLRAAAAMEGTRQTPTCVRESHGALQRLRPLRHPEGPAWARLDLFSHWQRLWFSSTCQHTTCKRK